MNDPTTDSGPPAEDMPDALVIRSVAQDMDVRGPDERGAVVQLAARWAEMYASHTSDDQRGLLERFRAAHDFVDAVIHGVEPPGP